MQQLLMFGGMLGGRLHRLAKILAHRVEPRIHRVLELGVRVLQPASHGIEPGVEFTQALVGFRVGDRFRLAHEQRDHRHQADNQQQADGQADQQRHVLREYQVLETEVLRHGSLLT